MAAMTGRARALQPQPVLCKVFRLAESRDDPIVKRQNPSSLLELIRELRKRERLGFCLDLDEKVFVFPKSSANSYVLLKPHMPEPLRQFTACLRFYTDLTRGFSLISCASKDHDNEILLFKESPTKYEICVGGNCLFYMVSGNTEQGRHWENICLAWNSTTGIVQFWVDGLALPRKGLSKGYVVSSDLVMMLGQDQDSYGGSLDEQQCFVGEMAEVYIWDTVLPPEQMRRIRRKTVSVPLLEWTSLNFAIEGSVLLEPTLE